MPLLRYRPCLPYTLQRYVSDVWLSLCFLLISLSSSPFLLWPHPRNIRGCVLIYDFSFCTHLPIRSLTRILPSPLLLIPPHSPLFSTRASLLTSFIYYLHTVIGPLFNSPLPAHLSSDLFLPQLISPPTHLFFNSPLLQPTSSSTHLSSNSPKTYLRYRDH